MAQKIKISLCRYQNGTFDLFIEDPDDGEKRICITGAQKFTAAELAFAEEAMPPCVMTTYEHIPGKRR